MSSPIGHIPADRVLARARDLARHGGAPVPEAAVELTDLSVSGPAEVLAAVRTAAADDPGIPRSSGGISGRTQPTYVGHHLAVDRLLEQWRPLRHDSVLLNLFHPGRLWAAHYYLRALAERSHCTVLPSGPFDPQDAAGRLAAFREAGVDTLAGTPSVLADFARAVLDAGETLPIKTLISMAEPWTYAKRCAVDEAFPEAGLWGDYGSVETHVIAANTPDCDSNVLHLLPDQLLEPNPGGALLTRVGGGWTVPIVRYRLGDLVAASPCRCGGADGLRVLGWADDAVKFFGTLANVGEILGLLRGLPGVQEVQLVLTGDNRGLRGASALTVQYVGEAPEGSVLINLLSEFADLRGVACRHRGVVAARRVERLARVERTGKIPSTLWSAAA